MTDQPPDGADESGSFRATGPDEDRTLERWGGVAVVASILAMAALAGLGHPLFWVPFALGIGVVLPALAVLADRRRA